MPDNAAVPRTNLPVPDAPYSGPLMFDAKDPASVFAPIEQLRPPAGAPNVLLILLDDVGFGASSAFGGPCATPTAERLAAGGLRFNRFHTTALCSPSRAALLTGRNHHTVGMSGITEIATAAPGATSSRPNSCAPLAETLRLNGYSTAQFGKCHEVPVWETSPVGPFNHWPTGSGFEKFYGFVAGETSQWYPELYDGTTPVDLPDDPDYHLMPDLADQAIAWIRQQKALAPDKPFFAYFAPGATHAPHHVPADWIERYQGRFDAGWDVMREQTLARQKALGVVPADTELTARHPEIPAWDDMDEALKPVLRRQMECYAAFLEYTDFHVGRLVDAVEQLEVLDDTLVFYVVGDNGASGEGTPFGSFNEMINFNGAAALETTEFMVDHLDDFGGPDSYNHYAVGWAHAMCAPFQWTKQVASHYGGTRNGLIVRWPSHGAGGGGLRQQWHHIIDIAPTILEAAGIPHPTFVNGVQQRPIDGTSLLYAVADPEAPDRRTTQHFEMFGNRGIYHQGWTAVTKHRTPWDLMGKVGPLDDDVWELYDTTTDFSQSHDLAVEQPGKLRELERLFIIEAARHNVFPIDDRTAERILADLAGRPTLIQGDRQLLFQGMRGLSEHSVLDTKNTTWSVTAEITVGDAGASGVICAQGANFGGWALYLKDGAPAFAYNFLGLAVTVVAGDRPVGPGTHQVRMELDYDGGGLGKGGEVTLYVDGEREAAGRVEHTHAAIFSADSTAAVGEKGGAPVCDDLRGPNKLTGGSIAWVQLDRHQHDEDHILSPEERYRIAMATQ